MMTRRQINRCVSKSKAAITPLSEEKSIMSGWALLQMVAVSSRAVQHIQTTIGGIKASANEGSGYARNYYRFATKHNVKLMESLIHEYDKSLNDLIDRRCKTKEELLNGQCLLAESLDESDDMLKPVDEELHTFFEKRLTAKCLTQPEDPKIIEEMLTAIAWIDMCLALWKYWISPEGGKLGFLAEYDKSYVFLSMERMSLQLDMICQSIDLRDGHNPQVKNKYNIKGIMTSQEMKNIMTHLRNIIFTSAFFDRISVAGDGFDPHFRDANNSIFEDGVYDINTKNSIE